MSSASFIAWSPLLGAGAWYAVAAYLVARQRFRTWTEVFFLGLCVAAGSYGLCDAIFFNLGPVSSPATLKLAATASLSSLTFAGFFTFLYGVSLYRRFRGLLLAAFVPVAFFVATFDERMFSGFDPLPGTVGISVPIYDPVWLYPWITFMIVLMGVGLAGIFGTFLEVRKQSPKLANRIGVILLGLLIAAVAGAATNALLAVSGEPAPPLFSTALAIPGVLIFFAVTPSSITRINEAILRRKASRLDVKGTFLTYSDGTLVGSKLVPGEEMIDPDAFSATLDVIQNFMRTSFPTLRGKWLKTIRHGDYTLVMERSKYLCLTLVLGGEENDQLRRQMQDLLLTYERENTAVFARWRGVAADAVGTDAMLDTLLEAT